MTAAFYISLQVKLLPSPSLRQYSSLPAIAQALYQSPDNWLSGRMQREIWRATTEVLELIPGQQPAKLSPEVQPMSLLFQNFSLDPCMLHVTLLVETFD